MDFINNKNYLNWDQIRELVNNEHYPGMNKIQWDAKNDKGDLVSSSLYLYTIETENFIDTKKMILLKCVS